METTLKREDTVGDVVVVKCLQKYFRERCSEEFVSGLTSVVEEGYYKILVDFSEVEEMAATGFQAIFRVFEILGPSGELAVCGASEKLREMFELTGMDGILRLFTDKDEAITSL